MKQQFPLKNVQQEKRIFRSRVFFAIGIVSFFMCLLVARYAYLQIFHHQEFSEASDKNRIRCTAGETRERWGNGWYGWR